MKVALDLDHVLVDILVSARAAIANDHNIPADELIHTNIYGTPFTHHNSKLHPLIQTNHDFWAREDVLMDAPPLPGAQNAVWRLAEAQLLTSYVTRRPPSVQKLTERWLDAHGFPAVPALHVGGSTQDNYYDVCKSTACKKYGATHIVDDQPKEAESLIKAGINVILIDADAGRDARNALLARYPHIPVAGCINDAVELLLDQFSKAA